MSEDLGERELRKQIETRYKKRSELAIHAVIFLVANAAFWLMFGSAVWLILMTLCWALALGGHFLYYQSQYGMWAKSQQNAVEREVQRELASREVYEKPKNDTQMRLTDDGELEEVPADYDEELLAAKPKRG